MFAVQVRLNSEFATGVFLGSEIEDFCPMRNGKITDKRFEALVTNADVGEPACCIQLFRIVVLGLDPIIRLNSRIALRGVLLDSTECLYDI